MKEVEIRIFLTSSCPQLDFSKMHLYPLVTVTSPYLNPVVMCTLFIFPLKASLLKGCTQIF